MEFSDVNLLSLVHKKAQQIPNELAYVFLENGETEKAKLTFGELYNKSKSVAALLQKNKLQGQRALLLYPTGIEFIIAFMGCLFAGVIPVPLACPKLNEYEKTKKLINSVILSADVSVILTQSTHVEKMKQEMAAFQNSPSFLILDTLLCKDEEASFFNLEKINNNTVAYLQYTSGSTSTPKGTVVSHSNLIHNIENSAKIWHYNKKSRTVTFAPHSHVYGLVCGLLVPLSRGTTTYILPAESIIRSPVTWLKAISKYKATHSGSPNFAYELCIQNISQPEKLALDLSTWKVAVNGGEHVKEETLIQFAKKFSTCGFSIENFCPAYGMSELTGTIAAHPYLKPPKIFYLSNEALQQNKIVYAEKNETARAIVSYGPIMSGLKGIIVNPETQKEVEANEIGELWLTGKSLVSGYWQNEEETQAVFDAKLYGSKKKYFRTGDLGFIHHDELFITGRLKEVIVVYGKKYYPHDLENTAQVVLEKYHLKGNKVAVTQLINDKEEVFLLVEVSSDLTADLKNTLIEKIRATISETHGIDLFGIILVESNSLPKTPSGKLQRKLCSEYLINNQFKIVAQHVKGIKNKLPKVIVPELSADQSLLNEKQFIKQFIWLIAKELNVPEKKIELKKPLSVYGFDSISITKLTNEINTTFDLTITPANIFEYPTLADFSNDLLNKIQPAYLKKQDYIPPIINSQMIIQEPYSKLMEIKDAHSASDVAIIGMYGIFPDAIDVDAFWNNLIKSKDSIIEIPKERWNWEDYYGDSNEDPNKTKIKWGGFITDVAAFDAPFFNISPREAELTDPQQRLFLQVVWKTIEDAGYSTSSLANKTTGLFVGVFNNDYEELLQKQGITDAYITTGTTHSILANRISYLLNLHGPSEAIDTACSSSLVAIHNAIRAIQDGDCDIALAGGVNLILTPTAYLDANKAGMLSEDGRCRTFDSRANGYVRAEGVAAVLLKPLHKALDDKDHIYGVIKGTAVNHGGHVSSLTAPNPNAQADVVASAFRRGNVSIDTVNYIETHGTGTALGDPIEISGLNKAFEALATEEGKPFPTKAFCGLGAVKTNIGHLEAAAGMAGVIKILMALKHKLIPGNIHFETQNPYIKLKETPFYIIDQTQPWTALHNHEGMELPRRAGVSSFGFGGTNAHVVIEEFRSIHADIEEDTQQRPYLIVLSAKTQSALHNIIKNLSNWIIKQKHIPSLTEVAYTLAMGRNHFDKRCVILAESISELLTTLEDIQGEKIPENVVFNERNDVKDTLAPIFSASQQHLYADLKNNQLTNDEYRLKLLALAHFYISGFDLDWEEIFNKKYQKISLPTYPFEKHFYWIPNSLELIDNFKDPLLESELSSNNLLMAINQDIVKEVSIILKIQANKITLDNSLSEFGFDSISFKELSTKLESRYGIEVNPSIFFTHSSIDALSEFFLNEYPERMAALYQYQLSNEKTRPTEMVQSNQDESPIDEPIAIVGMQAYFPQSDSVEEFWQHLEAGDDLISEIPLSRTLKRTIKDVKWAGLINDFDKFDANFFNISAREANLMDPQQRLFLEIVWRAIEDAGYNPFNLSGRKVGVFAGVEFNEYQTLIQSTRKLFHGHISTGTSHALIANRISYFLNLRGPSEVVDTACSSSLVAVHLAVSALQRRECSLAIVGGVSLMLDPDTLIITNQLGALSKDGRCKTFDKLANGYVKGEGVGALILKPLSAAERDSNPIYGIIKGSLVAHGGKAQSLTAPNAAAQSELLISTYQKAKVDAKTISYIETHGTGTELGDPVEIEGLKQAFNSLTHYKNDTESKKYYCGLGSVKTNIGHLEPASGIASIIKVLLSMQHEKLPRILHLNEVNPYIDLQDTPFYLVNRLTTWQKLKNEAGDFIPRRAGVSSFGFGGTYAHVILEEPSQKIIPSRSEKPYYLICLSAKQKESLQLKAKALLEWLQNHDVVLGDLSFTLNKGRAHFTQNLAVIVNNIAELQNALKFFLDNKPSQNLFLSSETNKEEDQSETEKKYTIAMKALHDFSKLSSQQYYENLAMMADLYISHYKINWDEFYKNDRYQLLGNLPPYPFIKQHYWYDLELQARQQIKTKRHTDISTFTLEYLKQIFSEKLRISPNSINVDETYEIYGVDSLIGLEITNQLQKDFPTLSKTILYEKNTLRHLSEYLEHKHSTILEKLIGQEIISPSDLTEFDTGEFIGSNESKDIAIIGLSVNFPGATNINEFWKNLVEGKNCITEIPSERWNYKDFPVSVGGEEKFFKYGGFIPDIDKFDPLFFGVAPKEAMLMDPQERLFMQTAWATLEDAGYTREKLKQNANNNVGVFAGVTYNFYPLLIAEEWQKGNRLPLDIQLFSVANRISYFLNLNGPSYIVDTACSSSLAAIHLACESLSAGESKLAIAGGVNLSLHPSKYHFLGGYGFLSDQGQCASFAEGGSGYVPGEGVGAVLLKPLDQAIHDKDRIYGVIKASHMNHGGKTSGYTVPNPSAQSDLIQKTLIKANMNPRTISYIEAHGTGTALGDPIEVKGLQEAFEQYTDEKQFCSIGSVKSNIGHLESAAGISQLAKVLLQMKYKKLVPSLHTEKLNPYINFADTPFYVQKELADWIPNENIRRSGISSFGAGGTNVHVILEEFVQEETSSDLPIRKPYVFLLSAMNMERLTDYALEVLQYVELKMNENTEQAIEQWFSDFCYTSQLGRESMNSRLALIVDSPLILIQNLKKFIENTSIVAQDIFIAETSTQSNSTDIDFEPLITNPKLSEIASLWIKGEKIPWHLLYQNFYQPQIIEMPTYPFAKRQCWVSTTIGEKAKLPPVKSKEKTYSDKWLYSLGWENSDKKDVSLPIDNGHWMIFSDKELGFLLQNEMNKENCTYIFEGSTYIEIDSKNYYINPNKRDDYSRLLKEKFAEINDKLKGIIYLWPIDPENQNDKMGFKLMHLFQALIAQQWKNKLLFVLVNRNSQVILQRDMPNIWQHYLWSATRIFAAEQDRYNVLLLDFDRQKQLRKEAQWITQEMSQFSDTNNHIAFRDINRFTLRLKTFESMSQDLAPSSIFPIEAALVTGGLGALGGEVTKWLAIHGTRFLFLTGTTPLPEKNEWETVTDQFLVEKIKILKELESSGIEVHYQSINIIDKEEMEEAVKSIEKKWKKPISGVFHLAGITTDSLPMGTMTDEIMAEVLAAKVQGSLVLHEIFNTPIVKTFVLFSSIASLPFFGMSGLSAYAMANEFLNGLAQLRQQQGLNAVSIDWAAWAEKGMSHRYDHGKFLEAVGMSTISIQKGLEILDELLKNGSQQNVIVFNIDWQKFFSVNTIAKQINLFKHFVSNYIPSQKLNIKINKENTYTIVIESLAKALQLDIKEIDPSLPYSSYGMDSIIGINFVGELNKLIPDIVSPMDLYKYPNVQSLVGYINEKLDTLTQIIGVTPVESEDDQQEENNNLDEIFNLKEEEISQLIEKELEDINKLSDSEVE